MKVAATKSLFSRRYVTGTICLDVFLFHVINRWHYFSIKVCSLLVYFLTVMLLLSLKEVFWKESMFYWLSLQFMQLILLTLFFINETYLLNKLKMSLEALVFKSHDSSVSTNGFNRPFFWVKNKNKECIIDYILLLSSLLRWHRIQNIQQKNE